MYSEKNDYILKNYNSIDVTKLIMAICVVALHTDPLKNCNNILLVNLFSAIINCAVPFFFLSTGFLIAAKNNNSISEFGIVQIGNSGGGIDRQLYKTMKLYMLLSIIYLPFAIFDYQIKKYSTFMAILIYIKEFFFNGEHYNSWILWYLLSTIYTLLFLKLFCKKKLNLDRLYILAMLMFIISCTITWISEVTMDSHMPYIIKLAGGCIRHTIWNGRIISGFYFIPLGICTYYYICKKTFAIFFLLIGIIGATLTRGEIIRYLFLTMASYGIFNIVLKINMKNHRIAFVCRQISIVMYCTHLILWTLYYSAVYGKKTFGFDSFVFSILSSCVVSIFYIIIKLRMKNIES